MKKFLSLVLALVMTMSLVTISAGAKDFTDADKVNYTEAVDVMSAVKVIDGYTDGSFNPQGTLTRGAAAKIICNLILGPTTAAALKADTAPFKDVPTDHTFAGYIAYCAKEGIISGYADGTFRPAATLTNYAFLKMLLGALGYDAVTEGYVGDNWSINVAKQALAIGLTDGLKDELVGTAPATREQACLYALNTMQATMIEYVQKTTVNVGGAEVVLAGAVRDVEWGTAKLNDGNIKADGFVQFAEKYFPSLELEVGHGIYGRPANTWKLKKAEIGTYTTKTPSFVYTEATDSQDVYKEMGKVLCDKDEYEWEAYINGKEVAAKDVKLPVKNDDDTYAYTGDGAVTEIYVEESYDAKEPGTVTVVEFNYYIGQVTKVKDTDDGETITVKALSTEPKLDDKTFVVDGYEEDDYVVFTVDFNDDNDYVIGEVIEPETVTGTVKRVDLDKSSEKTYLKLDDGESYDYSEKLTHNVYDLDKSPAVAEHPELNEEYTLYMDPNGFVLGFKKGEEEVKYLYVQDSDEELKDWVAKVVLADATQPKVDVKNKYKDLNNVDQYVAWNDADKEDNTNIDEQIWTYTVSDKGVYTLKQVENHKMTHAEINNGEAYVNDTEAHTEFIVDKQTVFVDVDGEKVYVGYDEVPNISDAEIVYVIKKGVAEIVFVLDGEIYDKNSTYFFLTSEKRESFKYDGDNYWMLKEAYVNGEKTTLNVAYDAYAPLTRAAAEFNLTTGVLYQAKKSIEDDGETYITKVELAKPDYTGAPIAVGDSAFQVKDDKNVTKFTTNDDTIFVLAEYLPKDLKAYEAAKKNNDVYNDPDDFKWVISEGRISDLKDDATDYVDVVKADDQKAELVYVYQKYEMLNGVEYTVAAKLEDGTVLGTVTVAKNGTATIEIDPALIHAGKVIDKISAGALDGNKIVLTNVTANTDITVYLKDAPKDQVTLTLSGYDMTKMTAWRTDGVTPVKINTTPTINGNVYTITVEEGTEIILATSEANAIKAGAIKVNGEVVNNKTAGRLTLTAANGMTIKKSETSATLIAIHFDTGMTPVPASDADAAKIVDRDENTLYIASGNNIALKFTLAEELGTKWGGFNAADAVVMPDGWSVRTSDAGTFGSEIWVHPVAENIRVGSGVKAGTVTGDDGYYNFKAGAVINVVSTDSTSKSVYATQDSSATFGKCVSGEYTVKANDCLYKGHAVTLGEGVKIGTDFAAGDVIAVWDGTSASTVGLTAVDTTNTAIIDVTDGAVFGSEVTTISKAMTLAAATKVTVPADCKVTYVSEISGLPVTIANDAGVIYVMPGTVIEIVKTGTAPVITGVTPILTDPAAKWAKVEVGSTAITIA